MRKSWLHPQLSVLLAVLLLSPSAAWAVGPGKTDSAIPKAALSETQKILHVLNRLGFGPRPGDIERVRKMGLESWIEQQLDPASIPDIEMAQRLAGLETLKMTPAQTLVKYPPPQLLRGIERQLRMPLPWWMPLACPSDCKSVRTSTAPRVRITSARWGRKRFSARAPTLSASTSAGK